MPTATLPIATVREAKAHLSEILERARTGGATVITSHGTIVARIMPPEPASQSGQGVDEALDAAVQIGVCDAPGHAWKASIREPVTASSGFSVVQAVRDMRR